MSISDGCGSLTFTIMSAASNTSAAIVTISAPTTAKSSSAMLEPSPAPCSTMTR